LRLMSADPRDALATAAAALAGELDLDDVLASIVESARQFSGARYAALGVIGDGGGLERFVHAGMDEETVQRIGPYPSGLGVLGLLIRDPRVVRLDRISDHPASVGFPDHHPPMDTFLGAPVVMSGRVYGNLYLAEKEGGFTDDDEAWITVLAAQAGAAIENALLSDRLQSLAVQQERDRISRDLHDGIIQSLFSIGMTLESATALVDSAPERARERISGAVDRIDDAIRELRNTIFHLRPNTAALLGLRSGIIELAREHEVNALLRPQLDLDRALDAAVGDGLVPDVLQVVREALSNVARHAAAGHVTVRARVLHQDNGAQLVVEVVDDGRGFVPEGPSVGRGLENVEERATVLGGTIAIDSTPGEGTRLVLSVPLDGAP
jgi:signal transduction histidine kinase